MSTADESANRVNAVKGTLEKLKTEVGGSDQTLGALLVAYYIDKLTSELIRIKAEIGRPKLPSVQ